MKNLSDIKQLANDLNEDIKSFEEVSKIKLFALYDESEEIKKVLNDLENVQNGTYEINEYGDLIYLVEVPKDIRDLPLINDYLTQDYACIYPQSRRDHTDLFIFQVMGEFISINWNHERNEYFVYDRDSRKVILEKRPDIEGHPEISEEDYVRAKIELYMRSIGVFGDVVEIDRYGSYVKHFEMRLTGRSENLDEPTNNELQTLVDKYEQKNDE